MKHPNVGIVIVAYNCADTIEACLNSVCAIKYPDTKILVVDNASCDATKKIIKEKYKYVELIENKKNLGYAIANNQGIKYFLEKNYDYILLLNPDTEIKPTIIENLLSPFAGKNVGIVGCAITYHHSKRIWYAGGIFHRYFCFTKHKKMNSPVDFLDGKVHATDFITGCSMMIAAEVFEKIGYLDSSYGFYFEDVDFCLRAKQARYVCKIVETPLVSHRVSSSSGVEGSNRLTPFKAYYYGRNPFILMKNHIHGWKNITAIFGQLFIRLPFHGLNMIRSGDFRALFEYLRGMRDGIENNVIARSSERTTWQSR